ncbi:MAG: PfkB family carbohydrate kinase [Clostridia bacterium]|nr:PfkB family carbohydrate kinase [Clostridia bacterium]
MEELIVHEGEALIADCDNIVLELDTSAKIAEIVLPLAKKYGKPVYTVVGNMSVILSRPEFVSALDCFVCNEIEAGRLFGEELEGKSTDVILSTLLANIGKLGCPSMVVTAGAQGAVYADTRTGERGICPAIPTKLVDSTGAGDAFLSGTVMGLARGMKLSEAVSAGTRMASLAISTTESNIQRSPDFWKTI